MQRFTFLSTKNISMINVLQKYETKMGKNVIDFFKVFIIHSQMSITFKSPSKIVIKGKV